MQLTDKVIVVTGAGSGIGRELALQLCLHGAVVAGVDYNASALGETAEIAASNMGTMSQHVLDVSQRDQIAALPEAILKRHSHVDGLINNAGIIHAHGSIEALPEEQVERVFNVNWWGTYYMVKAFLPYLRARPEAALVNISSMGGFMPFPDQVAYGASKAAIKLLTEGLRAELKRDSNIKVTIVYPGAVDTGITENSPDITEQYKQTVQRITKGKKFGVSPETAAAKIIRSLQRGTPRVTLGGDSWLLDKLYRLMPVTTVSLMTWLMGRVANKELEAMHER